MGWQRPHQLPLYPKNAGCSVFVFNRVHFLHNNDKIAEVGDKVYDETYWMDYWTMTKWVTNIITKWRGYEVGDAYYGEVGVEMDDEDDDWNVAEYVDDEVGWLWRWWRR